MMLLQHNVPELVGVIKTIAAETGKSIEDLLAQEGRKMSWELYEQAKAIPPGGMLRARNLAEAARSRSYRMGRRGSPGFAPAEDGISAAAWKNARNQLGGLKSAYFRVLENGEGAPMLRAARFSARSGRLLRNRAGRYADSALRSWQVKKDVFEAELGKYSELKRLNLRAVATANEIRLRSMAAKGGTVAVQWLPQFYKRTKSATVKVGPLVSHNERTNLKLGQVDFIREKGELTGVKWTGFVPGTATVFTRHDIPAKVEAARVADRLVYLNRKLTERYQKAAKVIVGLARKVA